MTSILALAGLLSSTAAFAQDDAAAGLFTDARQLPLVSQALAVDVHEDEAVLHLTQVFANDGAHLGQADYALHLPEGATVEGFGFWTDDRFLQAELQARADARDAHTRAATEGRATAIMDQDGPRHAFSVYPVEAGATKQVELTLRLPVEVEGGRRELRLPVDRFLGQGGATSTVTVRMASDRPLAELGLALPDGSQADTRVLSRGEHRALLAASTRQPLVLHWQEEAPPLDMIARSVQTPDGVAFALRVALNEAPGGSPWQRVAVLVDDSVSMRRRSEAVGVVIDQVEARVDLPLSVERVPDADWPALDDAIETTGCGPTVRCLVLTDAQLPGLVAAEGAPVELVVLADSHERDFFADTIPPRAAVYQPGVEPLARLRGQVDRAVLPVLEIERLTWGEVELAPLAEGPWRVAEGGLLRAHGFGGGEGRLRVEGRLGETPVVRELHVVAVEDETATRVRKAVYRDQLASWMRAWRSQPDSALQQRITDLSLREGIPTAFTSLQVDDPELSLVAIKPGDPTLRVDGAPGVTDVVAWYPFGDMRRLARDGDGYSDRFLVPRYWQERAYRVDTFERHSDGAVTRKQVWYVLDEAAPDATVSLEAGRIVVDTGDATPDIGAVELHGPGITRRLDLAVAAPTDAATRWTTNEPLSPELADGFTVVVRDRAGNVLRLDGRIDDGALVLRSDGRPTSAPPALATQEPPLQLHGDDVELDGHVAVAHLADRSLRFDTRGLGLRSLQLTAALDAGDRVLLGTRGGDLVSLSCAGAECVATALATGAPEHPVTGLALQADGSVLVGILGQGLHELRGDRLRPAPHRIGSRFVTGIVRAPDGDLLVGTGYDGLWRITGGRALKSRFPHDHVAGLQAPGDLLAALPVQDVQVDSGHGSFLRLARDRFVYDGPGLNGRDLGADDLVDLVAVGDTVYVAGFDSGLWRLGPEGELSPVALSLTPDEGRINALALHADRLWLATEGGLLAVDPDRPETGVVRVLPGAAHDLAPGEQLAVASSAGLFLVEGMGARRIDLAGPLARPTVGTGRYLSVAWHPGDDDDDATLWAGSLDGLVQFTTDAADTSAPAWHGRALTAADGFAASWVTALHSDGERLWIGTYADGLWSVSGDRVELVPALAGQWVPPGAVARIGDSLWVGGIGMPAARLDLATGQAHALAVPVRDSNAAVPVSDGRVLVATSDGLVWMGPGATVAAR